mmetsp:Transcript_139273/g.445225  ORF Transcript_139273/g.445225 Transcript_139273/m.445225 type:complete len:295 (-) Transcript_139273:3894-4778(-)
MMIAQFPSRRALGEPGLSGRLAKAVQATSSVRAIEAGRSSNFRRVVALHAPGHGTRRGHAGQRRSLLACCPTGLGGPSAVSRAGADGMRRCGAFSSRRSTEAGLARASLVGRPLATLSLAARFPSARWPSGATGSVACRTVATKGTAAVRSFTAMSTCTRRATTPFGRLRGVRSLGRPRSPHVPSGHGRSGAHAVRLARGKPSGGERSSQLCLHKAAGGKAATPNWSLSRHSLVGSVLVGRAPRRVSPHGRSGLRVRRVVDGASLVGAAPSDPLAARLLLMEAVLHCQRCANAC